MEPRGLSVIPGGTVTSPKGFVAGSVYAGLKKPGSDVRDVGLIASTVPAAATAVFTTNKVKAAPVIFSQTHVADGTAQAIVANSGCANACTGDKGMEDARTTAELTARKLGIQTGDILIASTGVIGVHLPMDKIGAGIEAIELSESGGHDFALAIITTDTRTKEIAVAIDVVGHRVVIGGAAKGAGMIHPNMATMLGFITTDAAVSPSFLLESLRAAASISFNMVTIDGDTSTNDSLFLLANGQAGNPVIDKDSPDAAAFQAALAYVCTHLAKELARDGEGATKLIEVTVGGALSEADARIIARTIASSSLLKSAVHGNDPNWGRILAAAGRSGAEMVESKTDVFVSGIQLMQSGRPLPFDKKIASTALDVPEVLIRVELNLGPFGATAWGCDLSKEYVTINSAYTT